MLQQWPNSTGSLKAFKLYQYSYTLCARTGRHQGHTTTLWLRICYTLGADHTLVRITDQGIYSLIPLAGRPKA